MKSGWFALLAILPVIAFCVQPGNYQPGNRNQRTWRLHEKIYQLYDYDSGTSLNDKRMTVLYSLTNPARIDSINQDVWDNFMQVWIPDFYTRYHYDFTGGYVDHAFGYYPGNPIPISKKYCSYDNQNRLTDVLTYLYNSNTQSYDLQAIDNYQYDDSYLVGYTNVLYLASTLYTRYSYLNDASGRHASYSMESSSDSLDWNRVEAGEITYHAQDTSTGTDYVQYLSYDWLMDLTRTDSFYGKVTEIMYHLDWNGTSYDYTGRYLYEFDDEVRLAHKYIQYYGADWVSVTNDAYYYDNESNLAQVACMNWDFGAGEWGVPYEKQMFVWELVTTANDDPVQEIPIAMTIYPSPFVKSTNIHLSTKSNLPANLTIYNLKGQTVQSYREVKSLTWDGTDSNNQPVSNGIYFIKAEQDGKAVTGKAIRIK